MLAHRDTQRIVNERKKEGREGKKKDGNLPSAKKRGRALKHKFEAGIDKKDT